MVPGVQLITAKHNGLDHVTALCDLALDTQLFLPEGRQDGTSMCVTGGFKEQYHKSRKIQKTSNYQIFRCTGLGFPEQLQVIVTCDVLKQRLSGVTV